MMPSRGSGRSISSCSAYARMLVSGVWRLWLTPRRKSSLAASSSSSWAFCASTWPNSWALRMATATSLANSSRRSWSARSQVRVAGSRPIEHADGVVADPQDGAQRAGLAGDDLLGRDLGRIDQDHLGIEHPEGRLGVERRLAGQELDAVARRGALDGRQDPPELAVAPLEVGGQAVVAVGEPGQLVVAGDPDRRREVAGGDAVDRRGDAAQRPGQVGRQQVATRRSRAGRRWPGRTAAAGRGSDRRRRRRRSAPIARTRSPKTVIGRTADEDQGEGQPGPEADPQRRRRRAVVEPIGRSASIVRQPAVAVGAVGRADRRRWSPGRAGSRRRGPSGGGPGGSGRARPSGAAGAS